jgi:hypothetical protein
VTMSRSNTWGIKWTAIMLSASILASIPAMPVLSAGAGASQSSEVSGYALTDDIRAEVKSIISEQTADGTRLGAIVKLTNLGKRMTRIPDYELRLLSEEGIEYVLSPSTTNAASFQPREKVELHYMVMIGTDDPISPSDIAWVEVDDENVYPRVDTVKLSIPIAEKVWQGHLEEADSAAAASWGEPFTIPELSPHISFRPAGISRQITTDGPATLITFLVENQSDNDAAVPIIRLDGRIGTKMYKGVVQSGKGVILGPSEKKYIHYAIPVDKNGLLEQVTVLTEEAFTGENGKPISYSVGWLNIQLPADQQVSVGQMPSYTLDTPISFGEINAFIQPEIHLALSELHMLESVDGGYKAVSAKFKLTNNSSQPLPIPNFQTELVSEDGSRYTGSRIGQPAETLLPQFSYVVSHTFVVPSTETGEILGIRILDGVTAAPYSIPISMIKAQTKHESSDEADIEIYPYSVDIHSTLLQNSSVFVDGEFVTSYKVRLDLGLTRKEKVLADEGLSRLRLELADRNGKVLASRILGFTGENRVVDGDQVIRFDDVEGTSSGVVLNIYESVETPFGEVVRLVKTVQ